jgi:hypothetical protein
VNSPLRYSIPGDVVLVLAVAVMTAFDSLRLAALASSEGDAVAEAACLKDIHRQLDIVHETLTAVVTEHDAQFPVGALPC